MISKKGKIVATAMVFFLSIGIISMVFVKKGAESNKNLEKNSTKVEKASSENKSENKTEVKQYDKYYIDEDIKDHANPENKEVYKKIYDAVEEIKPEIEVGNFEISEEEAKKLINAIYNRAYYEFFYLKDVAYNKEKKSFKLTYWTDKNNIEKMKSNFNKKVDDLVNNIIKPEKSDIEKEFRLFEYLSYNSKYEANKDVLNSGTYGILVNGKGICGDYSSAVKYILDKVGIEAHKVTIKTEKIFHAINQVKIDGEYYYVDASTPSTKLLERFNFTENELKINFEAKDEQFYLGNMNYKKIKPFKSQNERFKFLRKAQYYKLDNGWVYYCNFEHEGKIYKAKLKNDKSAKELISDAAIGMVIYEDYIYYINHSDSDYLYRVKKDGTDKKLIDKTISIRTIKVEDNKLYYTDGKKEITKKLPIK